MASRDENTNCLVLLLLVTVTAIYYVKDAAKHHSLAKANLGKVYRAAPEDHRQQQKLVQSRICLLFVAENNMVESQKIIGNYQNLSGPLSYFHPISICTAQTSYCEQGPDSKSFSVFDNVGECFSLSFFLSSSCVGLVFVS